MDQRLSSTARRPLAVALSGGGDSLALTLMADAWAQAHGRALIVLTVDHRLQAVGDAWTQACAATAARLRRPFRALSWMGDKPATGLPAAARAARHRLLADAARDAGAEVVLMGHTADDIAEAHAMRAAGSTTPDPHDWSPSPAWPEGRGVFLLRPLLAAGRGELRDWLRERGETWIDDPANGDLRYARARARLADKPCAPPRTLRRLEGASADRLGMVTLDRTAPAALLGIACVCAGGGDRRPARERVRRLTDALHAGEHFTATLAGARIEAGDAIRIGREAGEFVRGGVASLAVEPGRPAVWDGRFEIAADHAVTVRGLTGVGSRLSPAARRRLAEIPAFARRSLPVVQGDDGVACPLLEEVAGVTVRPLVADRLAAASGLVERERA